MAISSAMIAATLPSQHAACSTALSEGLDQTIRENAAEPAKASGDAGCGEQHSLTDQIEADRYLASKNAARKSLGARMTKVVPLGAS